MDLLAAIKNYQPYNDTEVEYKKSFIQFLETFSKDQWSVRENLIGHLSASAWVVNKDRSKVLFAYHNIYDSWAWLGGHADGELDLLNVAVKEAQEEAGLKNIRVVSETPLSIEGLFVRPHVKRGKFVPDHIHYNVTYLLEADENEEISFRVEESSAVGWIEIENLLDKVTDTQGIKDTYKKIMDKVKELGL